MRPAAPGRRESSCKGGSGDGGGPAVAAAGGAHTNAAPEGNATEGGPPPPHPPVWYGTRLSNCNGPRLDSLFGRAGNICFRSKLFIVATERRFPGGIGGIASMARKDHAFEYSGDDFPAVSILNCWQ